ncbi:MAG: hypothetical protein AB8F95_10420, partial [Bacteroidia bacterium]
MKVSPTSKSFFYLCILLSIVFILIRGLEQSLFNKKVLEDTEQSTSLNEASNDIMSKIFKDIEEREYNISFDPKVGKYQSPNRKHNIRTYFEPGKWQMQNRVDTLGIAWKLAFTTNGIYADGKRFTKTEKDPKITVSENQIDFVYPHFTEQYFNEQKGVRQNFIIHKAPEKAKELTVQLEIEGMQATQIQEGEIQFANKNKTLTYSNLKAWDATGKLVEAIMKLSEDKMNIGLKVILDQVTFPLTIDPIVANGDPTNADALLESNQA